MFNAFVFLKNKGLFLVLLPLVLTFGCQKDSGLTGEIKVEGEKILVDPTTFGITQKTIFNASGEPSYQLWVSGRNIDKNFKNHKVLFNTISAAATAGDSIGFQVPVPDAVVSTESVITIVMNGKSYIYPEKFKVEPLEPILSGISIDGGMRGTKLVISGSNFSPVISKNTVTINGVTATADSVAVGVPNGGIYGGVNKSVYGGLALYFTVPANATTGKLTVTSYSKSVSFARNYTVPSSSTFTSVNSTGPRNISFDATGNLYGLVGNTVVKITPAGVTTTLATVGDGKTTLGGCVVDAAGNVYLASGDDYIGLQYRPSDISYKIFKITPDGTVSVFAGSTSGLLDGQGAQAKFRSPKQLAIDTKTGNLYVNDFQVIRKITPAGVVSTLAGNNNPGTPDNYGAKDGQGTNAKFVDIYRITVDAATGDVYVFDNITGVGLRKITAGGLVSTVPVTPEYYLPNDYSKLVLSGMSAVGMEVDASGNLLVASGKGVFKIKDGVITNTYLNASANNIIGMTMNSLGHICISGFKDTPQDGKPTTFAIYKVIP